MFTVVSFLLAISLLVFVHELGHYLAARFVGVKVLEFSIGFPPKAVGRKIGETEYILSWIPIGGYVRLLGQDSEDENPEEPGNYASKSKRERLLILVAGPAMNLLFAWVFFTLLFFTGYDRPAYLNAPPQLAAVTLGSAAEKVGLLPHDQILAVDGLEVKTWAEAQARLEEARPEQLELKILRSGQELRLFFTEDQLALGPLGLEPLIAPLVGKLSPGNPAEQAGLLPGDKILAIGGEPVESWAAITPLVQKSKGEPFLLTFERDGVTKTVTLTPKMDERLGFYIIGLSQTNQRVSYGILDASVQGYNRAEFLTRKSFEFIGKLFQGEANKDSLGGPIMIAQLVGQAAKNSLGDLLALMGFISLQLGIFNLFPFPALDGGHVLFLGLEMVKGGPLNKNLREKVQKFGFSALLLLILYISVQDGLRLLSQ